MNRREFAKCVAASVGVSIFGGRIWAGLSRHPLAGCILPRWEVGHLRIAMLYTGRSEAGFIILPDGTSLLVDCGDYGLKESADIPFLPDGARRAGEQTARYVLRENPGGRKVDYFLLTHYHSDHAGAPRYSASKSANGTYSLCGIGQAIEKLDFARIIDRAWPDVNDPAPRSDDFDEYTVAHVKAVYAEALRRGTKIAKFELEKGSSQISPLHGKCDSFAFLPLCANGCILRKNGTLKDLGTRETPRSRFGENALSIGFVLSYGSFRYFTAVDFSGKVKGDDGSWINLEDALAEEAPRVDVVKVNHHGCGTMTTSLVKALDASVFLSGVWHVRHMEMPVMRRLASAARRPCLYAPGLFPASRRASESDETWISDVSPESFVGVHAVIDVPPGGSTYRLMMVAAADESWRILGAYDFTTSKKGS